MVALPSSVCFFQPTNATWRLGIVAKSQAMKHLLDLVERLAPSSIPVLLMGETGTGKEVLAHALHHASGRTGRFVPVNCAAIPPTLVESELFGHVRGAFTGAYRPKPGLIEEADTGTLFLDEVVELDLVTQAKLLRVLEDGEVRPLGGTRADRVHIRIVCATNQDIEAAVRAGRFRQDLYYRLSGMVMKILPLRERKDDIGPLVDKFLKEEARALSCPVPRLAGNILTYLQNLAWPGNVRQLRQAVQRAVVLGSSVLVPEDFGLGSQSALQPEPAVASPLIPHSWKQANQASLLSAIEKHGSVVAAARELGVPRSTAYDWVRAQRSAC